MMSIFGSDISKSILREKNLVVTIDYYINGIHYVAIDK